MSFNPLHGGTHKVSRTKRISSPQEELADKMSFPIDLLPIQQKSLDRAFFYTFLYTRFDRVALELLSLLCTFETSTKCTKVSFD